MRNRRTRKRGGMKAKNSSFKNRLDAARKTEEDVKTGTLRPQGKVGLVPIPVASKVIAHANVAEAMPVAEAVAVKGARDDVGSRHGNDNFLESKSTVNASGDFIDRINNTTIPKPPTSKPPVKNRTIKVKPAAPLPLTNPNDPKIKEFIANLKPMGIELPQPKLMPPNPPPTQIVLPQRKQPDFTDVIIAILEDKIISTEVEQEPNKTPEIDTTIINKFYNERILLSNILDKLPITATISGINMTIPWTVIDECTPILIAAKFGLVGPCKQILESVDDAKKAEMLRDYDKDAHTPLSFCAKYGYQELCEYLIGEHQRLGIPLEGTEWDRLASVYEKTEINELLGTDIALTEPYSVFLDELRRADPSKIENYDLVLKRMERISLFGDSGTKTPLLIASEQGHLGIVELLLCGGVVKKAMSKSGTRKNIKRDLRRPKEIARMCANPLAMTSEKQTALHLCTHKCCPSSASYETVYGNVIANDQYRLQYNAVHDDKYKNMKMA